MRVNFDNGLIWNKVTINPKDDTIIENIGMPILLVVKDSDVSPNGLEDGFIIDKEDTVKVSSSQFVFVKSAGDDTILINIF
jgi:hypothetical protein